MRKTGQSSFHQEKTILANKCRMCIPLLHLRYVELGDACEIIQRFVGRKLLTKHPVWHRVSHSDRWNRTFNALSLSVCSRIK